MNITVADVDIIAQAAEAVDEAALAEELLAIVDRFWGDYEPTPPARVLCCRPTHRAARRRAFKRRGQR